MSSTQFSEKGPLLPIANPSQQPPTASEDKPRSTRTENILVASSLTLLVILILLLYSPYFVPEDAAFAPILHLLGAGLQTSVWASLPAPAILFLLAPSIVQKERVTLARNAIFLGYLVGAALGSGIFGSDMRDAVAVMTDTFAGCIGAEKGTPAPPTKGYDKVVVW